MSAEKRKRIKKDPFLIFGVGITGYRSLLRTMIVLFLAMTLLSLPMIYIYSTGDGYCEQNVSTVVKITIGNLLDDCS